MNNDQRFVVVLFICLIAGSNSQSAPPCTDPNQQLKNMVVYEGNASSFFNQLDASGVKWETAPAFDPSDSPTPPYLLYDGSLSYPDVYGVTPTQLSIPKNSINPQGSDPYSTSGLYTLTYKTDGCQAFANLIVVSKGPLCTCTVVDSDNVHVTCQMVYGVKRLLPNYATMTWTTDSGDQVANDTSQPDQNNKGYDISSFSIGITSSDAATYTCGVTFGAPDATLPNMATNAPDFTASCTIANCAKTTETTSIKSTSTTTEEPHPATTTIIDSTKTTPKSCPKDLVNIVVNEGSVAVFENLDDGEPVKWHFSSSSDSENNLLDITDYDNRVNPMFVGAYNVTRTKLTILGATVAPKGRNPYANAGVYFLTYQSTGCQTAANLIVVQSGPACDRNEIDPDNVILSCNISYAESERQPSYTTMTWTTGGVVVVRDDNPTTEKYARVNGSLSQIAADNSATSYYQCQVTFGAPAPFPIPFLAQNAPSYTGSCTVASGTFPPTTEIVTTTAGTSPTTDTEITTATDGASLQTTTTDVTTTTFGSSPPSTDTEIATTTGVCANRPSCSSKWLSDQKVFCSLVQEFEDDCPAFCNAC